MKSLILEYNRKKHKIKNRLREFSNLHKAKDEDIFSELCFCILTPQSKAIRCDKAIKELKTCGLLLKGNKKSVISRLKGVRFPNNKAGYIIAARKFFKNGGGLDIKNRLDFKNPFNAREWLVTNIKGLGYKEASHFLRNIGLGKDMAILDTHILKNLKRYEVINKIPPSLTKKTYLKIESRMKKFSKKVNIPFLDLDLLFWSNQTGFIFK